MARSGGFDRLGGVGAQSLDPFGSGRGGLGRYFIGDTVSTIEALERYATSIGWQNGTVTDEAYLDSLRKWVNMSPEGSRDRISAQNTLDDAIYTIGRNKLVRNLNNSATDQERIGALNALIGYDRQKLNTMVGDNEARRELVDRIAGSQADIRGTRWNALVRDYNRHRVSNQAMLNFARTSREQAHGAPDQQTWEDRVFEFSERIADDRLQELQQDYEHDRIGGSQVLAFVDARLRGMSRSSPRFADLTRWREDFAVAFRTDQRAEEYETTRMDYQSGKISSSEWLRFLSRRVEQTKPNSEERRAAQFQLQMETFNIAEGRLIYDVAVNGTSPDRLIAFYRGALRTMDNGSARALDLQQRIRDLRVGAVNPMDLLGGTPGTSATPRGSIWGDVPGGNTGGYTGGYGPGRGGGGSGAEAMINAARSYLGVNYRLGQEGANGIDCSGLIYRAFVDSGMGELINDQRKRAAGYQNLFAGRGQVSHDRSELQRGDLVVYGGGSHIGIYLGDGKVMSALTTTGVTIHSLNGISVRPTNYILVDYEGTRPNPPPTRNQPRGPARNQPPPQRGETEYDSGGGGGGNRQARTARNPQPERAEVEETPQHSTGRLPVQGDVPGGGRVRERRETTSSIGAGATVSTQTQDTGGVRDGAPLPGALDSVARELLRQLRAPLTDANVRSVGAWLLVDNGGGTVYNNNPFNVRSPGDLGVDANGYGIFSSWQRGVATAADALTRTQPELVGSLRQGDDAERTVRLVERAGRYDGQMVTTYNGLQPDRPIYGTGNTTPIFNVPQSIADVARNVPDMAELFDVDVANPANVQWFEANVDAIRDASQRWQPDEPAPRWRFQTIEGEEVWVTYSPEMYDEMLNAQIGYAGLSGYPGKALTLRNDLVTWRNDVTIDIFDDQMEDFAAEESRLIGEGRLSEALAVSRSALSFAVDFMHLPPNTTDQNYSPRRDELTAEQWNGVVETLMGRKPQTADNPIGNALLGLTDPNADTPDGRPALTFDTNGRAKLNPNAAFVTQDAEGKLSVQTWLSDPRLFEPTGSRIDAQGNTDFTPRYMDETVQLDIGFGVPVRFARDTINLTVSIATTDGYRDPPDNITPQPPAPGQPMGLLEGFGDLLGKWFNAQPGMPNWSSEGLRNDQPQQARTPAADPGDYQLRPAIAAPLNVPMVRWIGPDGQNYMAYSLGDFQPGASVILAPAEFGDTPPRLVVTPGTLTVKDGQWVKANGEEWDAGKDGYGDFFHWYGQDARDGAGARDLGAPGNRFATRTVDAMGNINATLTNAEKMTVRDPDAIHRATTDYMSGQAGRMRVQREAPWLAAGIRGMEGGIFERPQDPSSVQRDFSGVSGSTNVGARTGEQDPTVINMRLNLAAGVPTSRLNGIIPAASSRVAAATQRVMVEGFRARQEAAALAAATPAAVLPAAPSRGRPATAAGVPPTATVTPRAPVYQAPPRPPVVPRAPVTTRVNLGPSTMQRPGSTAIVRERGETEYG